MRAPAILRQWHGKWLRRRLPPARRQVLNQRRIFIFPSGYGFLFLVIAASLFLGGINYENNLIMALSFLLTSLFVVAILHSFRNLSGVELRAGGAESGFAGDQGSLEVVVVAGDRQGHRGLRLYWPGGQEVHVSVEPGEERSVWLRVPLPRRGRVHPGRLRIESRWPLGWLRTWSLVDLNHECLAWPRPLPGGDCPSGGGEEQEGEKSRAQGSDDFQGLREYADGDSPRLVDWKAYARGGDLQTKLFSDPVEGWLWLEWERLPGQDPETRLSRLAWWVLEMERTQRRYGLLIPGVELEPARGPEQRREALDQLALYGES